MNRTKIEWALNPDGSPGYTWNPITGCLNHVNGMCKGGNFPCYAYRLANPRLKERYLSNKNWDTRTPADYEGYPNLDPFYPRFWEERLEEFKKRYRQSHYTYVPYLQKKRGIFVCDMSDLFGIGIPEEWTRLVLEVIRINDYDRFYLLTKQPQNLIKFSPFPDNCWVGVTCTTSQQLYHSWDYLWLIKAKVKYISFEPLLERIDANLENIFGFAGISWVIIGAQTKPTVKPKIEWVREIIEACDKAGVKVFLKNNLKLLLKQESLMGTKEEKLFWNDPSWKSLRQEMPK